MTFDPSKLDLSDIDTSKPIPMDAQETKALQNAVKMAIDKGGDEVADALDALLLPFELKYEKYIRENCPNHPSIARLDEYHSRKEMGLE